MDQDYVQFIRSFGGAYAGLSVHAFSNGSSIGRESVTELTLSFREDYKDTAMSGLLARSAVFSMDGSGNPILLDPEGRVLLIDHDNGDYEVIAESFAALIEENFYGVVALSPAANSNQVRILFFKTRFFPHW
ncbi:SMI1/KNR4 family protein [Paenibacillus rhizoplanae]